MISETQRRRNARFLTEQSITGASNGQQISGVTRDVNAEGVFFFTTVPIAEGSPVELFLKLPAGTIFSDSVLLRADGKVVRVEQGVSNGKSGVAVAFEHIQIDHSIASTTSGNG